MFYAIIAYDFEEIIVFKNIAEKSKNGIIENE